MDASLPVTFISPQFNSMTAFSSKSPQTKRHTHRSSLRLPRLHRFSIIARRRRPGFLWAIRGVSNSVEAAIATGVLQLASPGSGGGRAGGGDFATGCSVCPFRYKELELAENGTMDIEK